MSQVRLYLDEDAMRRSLVYGLRARGIDVLSATEADMVNRDDEDHLHQATSLGRSLYSYNTGEYCILHGRWLAATRTRAGIIVAPQQRYAAGEELRRILRLLHTLSAADMRNRLEYLSSW